ncbi:hypothetical protein [Flavobacterium sp.]|uniref:phosphoribosyltransferase-like protein n=1 Tax=Flavobacterium sp. TaxID=239 RepID=UPI0031E2AC67
MAHEFKLSIQTLSKIDLLLPRLKHSVFPTKIIRWLENFDENEVDLAIDLLSVYEYIPFNEFMFRLNDLLFEILKGIPAEEKIIIFPYGKVGKSGTLVTYPLKNTDAFKRRQNDILLTHDYENITNPHEYNHFVFLDDFIGSGQTFCTEYSKVDYVKNWIENNNIENVYLLSTIIMAEGKKYIQDRFSTIKIVSEERNKIFDKSLSPLKAFGNINEIENVAIKHGGKNAYGYDESQSLISYFHCTPNNTLPIIWSERKWFPIFPRFASIRMDEAREFKKEIAFYIGICNRLGIDLYTGNSIIEQKKDKEVRNIKHNTKQDHSVIALLTLKNYGYDNLIICHLLGLTREEIKLVYYEAQELGFINTAYDISPEGTQFLKELKNKTKSENFRKESDKNLEIKNISYVPQKFNGLT